MHADQVRGGNQQFHDRRALRENLERIGADRLDAARDPSAANVDRVAPITADHQRVRVAAEVDHLLEVQGQRVVAATGDVDHFHVDDGVIGNRTGIYDYFRAV